jgi:hypothetical protein
LKGTYSVFLGILLAGLGVIVPVAWDWWSKKSDLTVEVQSAAPVVNAAGASNGLQINYQGKPISSAYQFIFLVKNTGRTPIATDDIVEPLAITLKAGRVLNFEVIEQSPRDLAPLVKKKDGEVLFESALLNPGDYARLSLIAETSSTEVAVSARIKNIRTIHFVPMDNSKPQLPALMTTAGLLVVEAIAAALILAGIKARRRIARAITSLKEQTHPILDSQDRYVALRTYITTLGDLSEQRAQNAREAIDSSSWPLREQDKQIFAHKLIQELESEPNLSVLIIIAVIFGLLALVLIEKIATVLH